MVMRKHSAGWKSIFREKPFFVFFAVLVASRRARGAIGSFILTYGGRTKNHPR
jgi:hypothetical protein